MLSAPLKLTAMTLRGLGPYLHGARLEIKPLTILCGENGSGKSTWIEMLRLLKLTVTKREKDFPTFGDWYRTVSSDAKDPDNEGDVCGSCFDRGLLNANLLSFDKSCPDDSSPLAEQKLEGLAARERRVEILNKGEGDRASYGPAGCVGLEMDVQRELGRSELSITDLQHSLHLGDAPSSPQQLLWLGKIAAGSKIRLRLAHPSIPQDAVGCGGLDGLWDLIELTLDGQFTIHLRRSKDRDWSKNAQGRRKDARWAVCCSEAFLPDRMNEGTTARDVAFVNPKHFHVDELSEWMRCSKCRSGGHVEESKRGDTCDDCRKSTEMIESLVGNFRQLFRQLTKEVLAGFFPIGPIREIHALEVPRLAPSPEISVGGPMDFQHATIENTESFKEIRPDLRFVGERGENTQELFSYWAYNLMCQPGQSSSSYWFETFISYWLDRLVQARIQFATFPSERPDSSILEGNQPLNGSLIDRAFNWPREGPFAITIDNTPWHCTNGFRDLSRSVFPRTSTKGAAWHVMSTGFHQLAPIVVQAGLLRQNEIMAVENPEAHLHPSLQIKVAEFLMHQANAGKIMLIETHSDLIVRRIHRAIVQDQFAQGTFSEEMVGIHFTRLKDEKDEQGRKFQYAVCGKIEINDQGEIGNWPEGFLDADIKESRRMFDAMYGAESEDDNDGQ